MDLDGFRADPQGLRDLLYARSLRDQSQNLTLTSGENSAIAVLLALPQLVQHDWSDCGTDVALAGGHCADCAEQFRSALVALEQVSGYSRLAKGLEDVFLVLMPAQD